MFDNGIRVAFETIKFALFFLVITKETASYTQVAHAFPNRVSVPRQIDFVVNDFRAHPDSRALRGTAAKKSREKRVFTSTGFDAPSNLSFHFLHETIYVVDRSR